MRRRGFALLVVPLTLAGGAPTQPAGERPDASLQAARAEQAAAEKETARLEQLVARAGGDAARLRAQQAAAAQAIDAAEARITAADAQFRLTTAYVSAHGQRLIDEQKPVSALLAGLAVMARRPPLLALADHGGTDQLVEVRILLDSTLPVIRSRSSRLSAELAEGQRLQRSAFAARTELARSRQLLVVKRRGFAQLEQRALQRALATGGQALTAGDAAIAAGEAVEQLSGAEANSRSALALARQLAASDPAPPRPIPGQGARARPPFAYQLPAVAAVTTGFAQVNASGVRSRGLTLATHRGVPLTAPAAGTVRFSGPFRDYDGILILDHGNGWMTLIVNLATALKAGDKVQLGDLLGRALGPLDVELSHNGRRISPALIAGSSGTLSNGEKGG